MNDLQKAAVGFAARHLRLRIRNHRTGKTTDVHYTELEELGAK